VIVYRLLDVSFLVLANSKTVKVKIMIMKKFICEYGSILFNCVHAVQCFHE